MYIKQRCVCVWVVLGVVVVVVVVVRSFTWTVLHLSVKCNKIKSTS